MTKFWKIVTEIDIFLKKKKLKTKKSARKNDW